MSDIDLKNKYESKVIGGTIAFWKFKKEADEAAFKSAFQEFKNMVQVPAITRLVVAVEMDNPWGNEIQDLWIKTGEIADNAGIIKWGIYVPKENFKEPTIRFLVNGGGKGTRFYKHFISSDENEVINWAMQ